MLVYPPMIDYLKKLGQIKCVSEDVVKNWVIASTCVEYSLLKLVEVWWYCPYYPLLPNNWLQEQAPRTGMAIVCYTCAIQVVNSVVENFKSFTLFKACAIGSLYFIFLVAKTADSTAPVSTHMLPPENLSPENFSPETLSWKLSSSQTLKS